MNSGAQADAAFWRAAAHWDDESLRASQVACIEALAHDPAHVRAMTLSAEIMLRSGKPIPALLLLERATALDPTDPAPRLVLVRALRLAGDLRAAEYEAGRAREEFPADPMFALEHALALLAQGRSEEARVAAAGSPGETDPDPLTVWARADVELQLGQVAAAAATFARAEALDARARKQHALEASYLLIAGWREAARALLERGLTLMPDDAELWHMLAATEGHAPERASPEYVVQHFDNFASSFDDVLVNRLGYGLPEIIGAAAARAIAVNGAILDAGCGTGLCAVELRPFARRLLGVDLSPQMVQRARALGVYDELVVADILPWLNRTPERFDVIVAADVVVYFGNLRPLVDAFLRVLCSHGTLLFTTELGDHDSFRLDPSGRFSHGPSYVAAIAATSGLEVLEATQLSYRRELGEPVQSMLWMCRRR